MDSLKSFANCDHADLVCAKCGAISSPHGWSAFTDRDKLAAEVERLREERRWIPVEERLPKPDEPVFLVNARGMHWTGCLSDGDDGDEEIGLVWCNAYGDVWVQGGRWCSEAEWDDDYEPTHWHPFPQPMATPPA